MKRKIRLAVLGAVMILGVLESAAFCASAEELTSDKNIGASIGAGIVPGTDMEADSGIQEYSAHKKGWDKEGKYKYYYNDSGKMQKGWKKIGGKLYYFRKKADSSGPKGSMATGFCRIDKKQFYFSKSGVLQHSGWRTIKGKNYYLTPRGNVGTLGAMYTGLKKIGDDIFYFQKDGSASIGWTTYKGKQYYFSTGKILGLRGRAIKGWRKIDKHTYYFAENGVLQKNRWIDGPNGRRYVDTKGRLLRNGVSPAGWKTDEDGYKIGLAKGWFTKSGKTYYYVSGKKTVGFKKISGKKYYFNKNGVRKDSGWITVDGARYYIEDKIVQTGRKTIDGKEYYFRSGGKLAVNTTLEDGSIIGADGVVTPPPVQEPTKPQDSAAKQKSVLIIAGHGQGDVGAVGYNSNGTSYEYQLTREFANLIYNQLKAANPSINVKMYDQNYDCYQVMSGQKAGPKVKWKKYDYILEVHFNATVQSSKDPKGNGQFKGVGMYINYRKKDYQIDRNIVAAIARKTGFKVWGGGAGIFASGSPSSKGLFNARTAQEAGVSYGLLETAFIDDRDDIDFYKKNKNVMAKAVAEAISSSLAD